MRRAALRVLLSIGMIGIGVAHFLHADPFVRIMPGWLPAPLLLVYVSGFFEILGGVGLLLPATRRAAAWGLIALYLAVFPANVNMAIHHLSLDGGPPPPAWVLWLRLPLQALLIAWAAGTAGFTPPGRPGSALCSRAPGPPPRSPPRGGTPR